MKLYHKLEIQTSDFSVENACCQRNLQANDEDIELIESCFEDGSNLSDDEKSTLYYISGYIAHKEHFGVAYDAVKVSVSQFTTLVPRGKLIHPPQQLYDLSLYFYCFFKHRSEKCCTKIFLQTYL